MFRLRVFINPTIRVDLCKPAGLQRSMIPLIISKAPRSPSTLETFETDAGNVWNSRWKHWKQTLKKTLETDAASHVSNALHFRFLWRSIPKKFNNRQYFSAHLMYVCHFNLISFSATRGCCLVYQCCIYNELFHLKSTTTNGMYAHLHNWLYQWFD